MCSFEGFGGGAANASSSVRFRPSTPRPRLLTAQDGSLSRSQCGFDSRRGHHAPTARWIVQRATNAEAEGSSPSGGTTSLRSAGCRRDPPKVAGQVRLLAERPQGWSKIAARLAHNQETTGCDFRPCNPRCVSETSGSHKADSGGSTPPAATGAIEASHATHVAPVGLRGRPLTGRSAFPSQRAAIGWWGEVAVIGERAHGGPPASGAGHQASSILASPTTQDERAGERSGPTHRPRRVRSPGPAPRTGEAVLQPRLIRAASQVRHLPGAPRGARSLGEHRHDKPDQASSILAPRTVDP